MSREPNDIVDNIGKDMIALWEVLVDSDQLSKSEKTKYAKLVKEYEDFVNLTLKADPNALPEEIEYADKYDSMEAGSQDVSRAF